MKSQDARPDSIVITGPEKEVKDINQTLNKVLQCEPDWPFQNFPKKNDFFHESGIHAQNARRFTYAVTEEIEDDQTCKELHREVGHVHAFHSVLHAHSGRLCLKHHSKDECVHDKKDKRLHDGPEETEH